MKTFVRNTTNFCIIFTGGSLLPEKISIRKKNRIFPGNMIKILYEKEAYEKGCDYTIQIYRLKIVRALRSQLQLKFHHLQDTAVLLYSELKAFNRRTY